MEVKTYKYNGVIYYSDYAVRQAISDAEGIAFGDPQTADEWLALGVTYEVKTEPDPKPHEPTPEELAQQELAKAKAERAQAVRNIKVTVADKVFDGDESAQSRMTRAIQVAEISGLTQTEWVLANNEVAVVTLVEMKEALSKAMLEMSKLWTKPYTEAKQ